MRPSSYLYHQTRGGTLITIDQLREQTKDDKVHTIKFKTIKALFALKWKMDLRGAMLDQLLIDRNTNFVGVIDTSPSMFMYDDKLQQQFVDEIKQASPSEVIQWDRDVANVIRSIGDSDVAIVFTDQTGHDRCRNVLRPGDIIVVIDSAGLDCDVKRHNG